MVTLGDSITAASPSWENDVASSYNDGKVHITENAGSGYSIMSNLDAMVASVSDINADMIIIELGINDNNAGDMGALQAEAEENISELNSDHPGALVCWFILPSYTGNNPGDPLVDKSNIRTAVAAACTAQGATYWDSVSDAWIDPDDTSDGTHPTEAGHAKIAAEVVSRLPS